MCINLNEKIISIKKVSKPNRGLTSMSYSILLVVGDGDGGIGFGKGNDFDQNLGILKALVCAKKNFFKVPLNCGTIYHEITGKHASSTVFLIPSKYRCGLFAGGAVRIILDVMGVFSIISKIHGSSNPYNITRATINALSSLKTPFYISLKRGLKLKKIF